MDTTLRIIGIAVYLLNMLTGCNTVDVTARGMWGRVHSGEFCDYEDFTARCGSGETLLVLEASYGHMEIGKCITEDIGYLGCQSDVTVLLRTICNGEQFCELATTDRRLRETSPCRPGIVVYVKASYACLKAIPSHELCNGLQSKPSMQYISSEQLSSPGCLSSQNPFRISGQKGQNISFSVIRLSDDEISSVGLIINEETQEHLPISIQHQNNQLGSLKANSVLIAMDQIPPNTAFVLAYQAVGCADIDAPRDAVVTRTDTDAKVSCIHSNQSWNLKCRGVHWLGIIGNCTIVANAPITARPKVIPPVVDDDIIEKDVIYVIVICITIFLSVLVITTGYVCLRTARIQSGLECRKKPTEPEWAFGTNQTMTLLAKQRPDSDYLQPMYPGDAQNVMPAAIYDTPPPNPMQVPQDNTCTSVKQNNDEDYNATVSSTSTDYKKYFVLDKDYMNTKEFINDL
ncbi:hypothetical protein CAPTEDRAFT_217463 [Capitella teleta]|uniref:SUEL-type lectin domain-containing protein n=1 Tax=Capitella teleta TaxID=283909 RepID=R7UGG5_CAPTE|nr:hypothetical protein CAPTEDRAFT_217463 [Capitella teleta]|eukprot:ELU05619.1 hypothetical protein CAPTEDRAFT_217463 [Capitella teleta]